MHHLNRHVGGQEAEGVTHGATRVLTTQRTPSLLLSLFLSLLTTSHALLSPLSVASVPEPPHVLHSAFNFLT